MSDERSGIVENRLICVYGIRCKVTKRIYIGSSYNVIKRVEAHFKILISGCKVMHTPKGCERKKHPFQSDFDEFGIDSFEVFVLEQDIPECMRDEREEFWIDKYQSTNPRYGYNLSKKCNVSKIPYSAGFYVPIHYECPPFPELEGDVNET